MKRRKTIPSLGRLMVKDEKGTVIVMAVMVLAVVLMFSITAAIISTAESNMSGHAYQQAQAFYLAEGYNQFGLDSLKAILRVNLNPTIYELSNIKPPEAPEGYTLDAFSIKKVDSSAREITQGPYKNANAIIETYHVTSTVSRSEETTGIQQGVEHLAISVFDFYIIFNGDLELYYTQPMSFNGRIHCNGSIYVNTTRGMEFNGSVTAVDHIYHHIKGGVELLPAGYIDFMD